MTDNVLLRGVTESDLPILFEHQLDPDATAMAAFPSRDRDAFMAHWAKIMADNSTTLKTILFDDQVAGSIACFELLGELEVGYWIGREFWGKGIATRALALFLDIVKTRPLYGHVAKHNLGSKKVLEKNGFTVVGEDTYVNPAGEEVEEFVLRLE